MMERRQLGDSGKVNMDLAMDEEMLFGDRELDGVIEDGGIFGGRALVEGIIGDGGVN